MSSRSGAEKRKTQSHRALSENRNASENKQTSHAVSASNNVHAELHRSRSMDSLSRLPMANLQHLRAERVRELEQQLESSLKNLSDTRTEFKEVSEGHMKMKKDYERRFAALDNDHQAAVKYLRGTEKMLSKMKQELQRLKDENRALHAQQEGQEAARRQREVQWEGLLSIMNKPIEDWLEGVDGRSTNQAVEEPRSILRSGRPFYTTKMPQTTLDNAQHKAAWPLEDSKSTCDSAYAR